MINFHYLTKVFSGGHIELILDGNSEIGAHVRSILCYLIYLRHLIRSRKVTHRIFLHAVFSGWRGRIQYMGQTVYTYRQYSVQWSVLFLVVGGVGFNIWDIQYILTGSTLYNGANSF